MPTALSREVWEVHPEAIEEVLLRLVEDGEGAKGQATRDDRAGPVGAGCVLLTSEVQVRSGRPGVAVSSGAVRLGSVGDERGAALHVPVRVDLGAIVGAVQHSVATGEEDLSVAEFGCRARLRAGADRSLSLGSESGVAGGVRVGTRVDRLVARRNERPSHGRHDPIKNHLLSDGEPVVVGGGDGGRTRRHTLDPVDDQRVIDSAIGGLLGASIDRLRGRRDADVHMARASLSHNDGTAGSSHDAGLGGPEKSVGVVARLNGGAVEVDAIDIEALREVHTAPGHLDRLDLEGPGGADLGVLANQNVVPLADEAEVDENRGGARVDGQADTGRVLVGSAVQPSVASRDRHGARVHVDGRLEVEDVLSSATSDPHERPQTQATAVDPHPVLAGGWRLVGDSEAVRVEIAHGLGEREGYLHRLGSGHRAELRAGEDVREAFLLVKGPGEVEVPAEVVALVEFTLNEGAEAVLPVEDLQDLTDGLVDHLVGAGLDGELPEQLIAHADVRGLGNPFVAGAGRQPGAACRADEELVERRLGILPGLVVADAHSSNQGRPIGALEGLAEVLANDTLCIVVLGTTSQRSHRGRAGHSEHGSGGAGQGVRGRRLNA